MKILRSIYNMQLLAGARGGNLKKVNSAIKSGADINARKDGWTAWMYAYANYHAEVVRMLESNGATVTDDDRIKAGISAKMNKACNLLPHAAHAHPHQHHAKLARN